jgi:hypothetical protein
MQMNFFSWIRQGVKHSVLLGVSDAAEQLGIPGEDDTPTRQFIATLRDNDALTTIESKPSTNRRRRLGKSLKEVDRST